MVAHLGKTRIAIVKQFIAIAKQRIALHEPHMAESIERVAAFVEIGRVAIHQRIIVAEAHIPLEYLRIGVALLIEDERLCLLQIDHRLGLRPCSRNPEQTKSKYSNPFLHVDKLLFIIRTHLI